MKKNKKNNKKKLFRQGDVLLIEVDSIPEGLVTTEKVTLALGEVTGHHHTIYAGATGFADSNTALAEYIEVTNDVAELTHQEHSTISVPSGKYKNVIQTEYTPERLRQVAD
jgi:hypothetical protein